MTTNFCTDICSALRCNPSPDNEMFKYLVLRALCGLVQSEAGTGVVQPQVTIAFGTLTNAFADTTFLDATKRIGRIHIRNQTDSDVAISVDAGATTAWIVPSNQQVDRDLGPFTALLVTSLQIKYLGAAPTQGNVYIDGSY